MFHSPHQTVAATNKTGLPPKSLSPFSNHGLSRGEYKYLPLNLHSFGRLAPITDGEAVNRETL